MRRAAAERFRSSSSYFPSRLPSTQRDRARAAKYESRVWWAVLPAIVPPASVAGSASISHSHPPQPPCTLTYRPHFTNFSIESRGTPTSPWKEPAKNRQYEGGALHSARSVGHADREDGVRYFHFVRCEAGLWTAQLIVSANREKIRGNGWENRSPAMFYWSPP